MHHYFDKSWKFGHYAMRKHGHGRHGFGPFAGGFADGTGMGGGGFRTGRKLAASDLQLVILALLGEKPHHGYEIIKALEERSGGFYAPSPGMVYPALTYLEEVGQAEVESVGTKKLYRLTEAGKQRLAEEQATAEAILTQLERIGRKMERVREVFAGDAAEEDMAQGLRAARHELRQALRERRLASPEEQQRIAEILRRTIGEIRGK